MIWHQHHLSLCANLYIQECSILFRCSQPLLSSMDSKKTFHRCVSLASVCASVCIKDQRVVVRHGTRLIERMLNKRARARFYTNTIFISMLERNGKQEHTMHTDGSCRAAGRHIEIDTLDDVRLVFVEDHLKVIVLRR